MDNQDEWAKVGKQIEEGILGDAKELVANVSDHPLLTLRAMYEIGILQYHIERAEKDVITRDH